MSLLDDRVDRVYNPGEKCEGTVIVNAYKGWQHQGLKLSAFGYVYLNTSAKGVGIMDVMSSGLQPIMLLRDEMEIASSGSFAEGKTSIPFEFQVAPVAGQQLYESYHGVFVNVIYAIRVECDRGLICITRYHHMLLFSSLTHYLCHNDSHSN